MLKKIGVVLALFLVLILIFSEFDTLLLHLNDTSINIIQPVIIVIVTILPILAIGSVVMLELSLLRNGELKRRSTHVFRKILLVLTWIIAIDIISLSSINMYLMLVSEKCHSIDTKLYILSNLVGMTVMIVSIILGNEANKEK